MAKWNFAALAATAVLALSSGDVRAQKIAVTLDGCAVLARTVYEEVWAAAAYGPGSSGPWQINPPQDRRYECDTVATTVSRAFTAAMAGAGFEVRWGTEPHDRGDFCLSMYLSQCYPDRGNDVAAYGNVNGKFVRRSWSVVSQTVMREMANPYSSDEVRFNDENLRLRLGLGLRSVDGLRHRGH